MKVERTRCGTLRAGAVGTRVTLFGWIDRRRDHGGLIFLDLRDRTGIVQVVVNPDSVPAVHEALHEARLEWVVRIAGTVVARTGANVNPKLPTGEVEVQAEECEVLATAKTLPFAVNDDSPVDEKLRLTYRYLDLRRQSLQHNLRQRARFITGLRDAMNSMEFLEIETPLMVRATPEGSRDYLVPSRIFPGSFYALPQSPQLYKQLCMVAGLDRYFQIARCMRDEDLRADRQPEFTQLDVEMSFIDEEDVFAALEYAISSAWKAAGFRSEIITPFPRITWTDAMERYGVDKPDTRFSMELQDVTAVARSCGFKVFSDAVAHGGIVKAIVVSGGEDLARSAVDNELLPVVRTAGAKGLAPLWRGAEGWHGAIAKFFTEDELARIADTTHAEVGDCVLFVADKAPIVAAALGALRNHLGRVRSLYNVDQMNMIWVTEFPMFERDEETGVTSPLHHPFTMMHPDDLTLLETDPLKIRSRAYDIVLNGREIGSGSIRITDPVIQQRVFSALGINAEQAAEKFGFLLEAFTYGVPPHGGFAAGIDRLVMEGLGEENIRDVIAFPKNQQAHELMTHAPATVDDAQLKELGLTLRA